MSPLIKDAIKNKLSFTQSTNGLEEAAANKLRSAGSNDSSIFFTISDSSSEGLSDEQVEEKVKMFGA